MRYLARTADGDALLGDDGGYVPLSAAVHGAESVRDILPETPSRLPDPDTATARQIPSDQLTIGPPLAEPGKLFGIGLNYGDHAADLDEDAPEESGSFLKASSADHLSENLAARELELDEHDIATIDGIDRERRIIDREYAPWNR